MKKIIRKISSILTSKWIFEKKLIPLEMTVSKSDITYFNLSSNPIIMVEKDGEKFYFRESPRLGNIKLLIRERVDIFFEYIRNVNLEKLNFKQAVPIRLDFDEEEISSFRQYIFQKLGDKNFIKELLRIDKKIAKINFSIWGTKNFLTYEEISFLGFEGISKNLINIVTYFIWYVKNSLTFLNQGKNIRGKSYIHSNSTKSISSYIIAQHFGLENLIIEATWCKLSIDNKPFFGVISPSAQGIRGNDIQVLQATPLLQRELINLNVLDVICFQLDHGPNNYNVEYSEGVPSNICAFDNDNPATFFPIPTIRKGMSGCLPMVDSKGFIQRVGMDLKLAEEIIITDKKVLNQKLKPYLNLLQRKALFFRIKKLGKAIEKTRKHRADFLKSENDWTEETVRMEISNEVGKTYLTSLLSYIK